MKRMFPLLALSAAVAALVMPSQVYAETSKMLVTHADNTTDSIVVSWTRNEAARTARIYGGTNTAAVSPSDAVGVLTIPSVLISPSDGLTYAVTEIGRSAFTGCTDLTNVVFPNGLTTIGQTAFQGCTSLTTLTLPRTVTTMGAGVFNGCTSLVSQPLPSSLTSIPGSLFSGCTSLTSIDIPEGVTTIGSSAFSSCTSLTSVVIPSGVSSIGTNAFTSSALTAIDLSSTSVTSLPDNVFSGCTSLASVILPSCLTKIAPRAFNYCSSLTSIDLPEGLTTINNYAFQNAALEAVTFPSTLTTIGDQAFDGCSSLATVTFDNCFEPTFGTTPFAGCPSTGRYIYPAGAHSYYAAQKSNGKLPGTLVPVLRLVNEWTAYCSTGDFELPSGVQAYVAKRTARGATEVALDSVSVIKAGSGVMLHSDAPGTQYELSVAAAVPAADATKYGSNLLNGVLVPNRTLYSVLPDDEVGYLFDGTAFQRGASSDVVPQYSAFLSVVESNATSATIALAILAKYKLTYQTASLENATDVPEWNTVHSAVIEYGYATSSYLYEDADDMDRLGWSWSGWSVSVPETMPGNDLLVQGYWVHRKYAINYYVDGTLAHTDSVGFGSATPALRDDSIKAGYTFSGWSLESLPATMPAGDINITADFGINKYLLTYLVDGSDTIQSDSVVFATELTPIADQTKEGHTFSGWSAVPATMPDSDVTITATFTVIQYNLT